MVVQEEDDAPIEAPLSKTKKYVVVKNHVRELLPENKDENQESVSSDSQAVEKTNTVNRKNLKRKKGSQKLLHSVSEPTVTNESDLEELKTVYRKCKAVLQKIELKYGHLLDLEDNESFDSLKNITSEESSCDYCTGSQKKKIIFDENGEQTEKDCQLESHICVKRTKKSNNNSQAYKPSVKVEYDSINMNLPNNLQELESILKCDNISKSYRRIVIDKIYLLRQEYLNEIRYEKQGIIEKLKANPDDVLDFKGTNLSSLHGYPSKPVVEREK